MRPRWCRLVGLIGLLLGGLLLGIAQGSVPQGGVPAVTAKHTIFDYKTDLLLTDQQEQEIRQILAGLARELDLQRARLTMATHELAELLKREAPLRQIKQQLELEAALRAALSYEDIAASRRINAILSPEQLSQWRNIQARSRVGKP
ncbi:MAG: hypothetical protein NTX84_08405 [Nitrospirae bacterium]|nr:hypothetical protein [Nitrospirota bacterium]